MHVQILDCDPPELPVKIDCFDCDAEVPVPANMCILETDISGQLCWRVDIREVQAGAEDSPCQEYPESGTSLDQISVSRFQCGVRVGSRFSQFQDRPLLS